MVNQDGELDVSGGGHGIDITGDSATVDNKGGMTVTDPDSIGIQIDGDKAVVNNDGDSAISNGGTGTQVNGVYSSVSASIPGASNCTCCCGTERLAAPISRPSAQKKTRA
ncbi:hypothetical protein BFQ23_25260 [Escherichia coli]|nr:hypothetical protein BFQ23_25260 [Escherichia coli]